MKIWSSSTQKCHRASAFVDGWCAWSRAHADGLPALGRTLPGGRRHRELWRRILGPAASRGLAAKDFWPRGADAGLERSELGR